jgi:hypothetical protein
MQVHEVILARAKSIFDRAAESRKKLGLKDNEPITLEALIAVGAVKKPAPKAAPAAVAGSSLFGAGGLLGRPPFGKPPTDPKAPKDDKDTGDAG